MKNKKTIALAMAAMSVSGSVIPAFASERAVTPLQNEIVDLRKVNGKEVVIVDEKNLEEYLRSKSHLNPKEIAKKQFDNVTYYAIELDKVLGPNDIKDQANEKVQLEKLEKQLNEYKTATYTHNGVELPKYKIVERIQKVDINIDSSYTDSKRIVTITDLEGDLTSSVPTVVTYTYTGVDAKYSESLDIKYKTLDANVPADVITLGKNIYELEKAIEEKGLYVTTEEKVLTAGGTPSKLIHVYLNDKRTKVGQITINNYNKKELDKKLVRIPVKNDFKGHWAEDFIVDAMLKGRVDLSDIFRTEASITRAEFAKMICTVNELPYVNQKEPFSDVKQTDWYYEYVSILSDANIMNGYPDGTFNPDAPITRQEAAKTIAALYALEEATSLDANGNTVHKIVKTKFDDTLDIQAWADESVKYLSETKPAKKLDGTFFNDEFVLTGYKENGRYNFKPNNNIKRAEALTMIYKSRVSN